MTRLWVIDNPNAVVFDEIHFGNFTNWYTNSEYFFDIHPPLAKLLMFLFANLSEYDGSIDFNKYYGNDPHNDQYIILRLTPALFSSLCAPLIYLTLRFDSFSYIASISSSLFIIFDTSLLTEQRYILSDGILHFFTCLFVCIFSYTLSINDTLTWLFISGFALGGACSCKNTAFGLMVYSGIFQVIQVLQQRKTFSFDFDLFDSIFTRAVRLIFPIIIVFLGSFLVHFIILPYSGQGTPYLPDEMKEQLLIRDTPDLWGKRLRYPSLIFRCFYLIVDMHRSNMEITSFHSYQSRPINWPLLTGNFVGFWNGSGREVNCMGNVFVYYISFVSIFVVCLCYKKEKFGIAIKYVLGWAISYFPFFLIPRSMFLYHYLIPLIMEILAMGAAMDLVFGKWAKFAAFVACVMALIGFVIWSPFAYGTKMWDRKIMIWNENWVYGDKYHRDLQAANDNNENDSD